MNILEIDKPVIVNDVLHNKDNINLLDYLLTNGKFTIGVEDTKYSRFQKAMLDDAQHSGFYYAPKNEDNNTHIFSSPLTTYGFVVANQICKTLGFTYNKITRIAYNYYCRDQFTVTHTDSEENDKVSIIYNPFTTDGGTIILGEKYQDIACQAKVFKSNWLHSSWPTVKDKARVSLNIVIQI